MKSRQALVMTMLNPGSRIYTARSEWQLEITREPRPSCLDRWKMRDTLRNMQPGATATINGVKVYRKNLAHQASRYLIDGVWLDVTATIEAIEAGKPQTQAVELHQLELNLGEAI